MKKPSNIPTIAFFTFIMACCFCSLLASDSPVPPTPPPSPLGSPRACPNTISPSMVAKFVRNGVKAGVIKTTEGLAEEDIVKGMMATPAPTKQSTTEVKPVRKPVVDSRSSPMMMEELNKRLLKRSQTAPVILPTDKPKEKNPSDDVPDFRGKLRKSGPGSLQSQNDQASNDQPTEGSNPWGVKLRSSQGK